MNRDFIYDFSMAVTVFGLLIGIIMSIITKMYLNRLKTRRRFIELIWGVDNDWHKGKSFDFIMANVFAAGATFTAWRMQVGLQTKKQGEIGAYAYPELHRNNNYKKLLQEFPFLVRWEFTRNSLFLASTLGMLVSFGINNNWW